MRDQILSDDFLTCYLTLAEDELLASLPDERDIQVRFSDRFRRRMKKLVARSAQPLRGGVVRLNRRAALLVAAMLLLLLAAAGYYSVSDAFRGVFTEQSQTGETVPVASLSPVVDKAGVLPLKTASKDKIDVTLRAAVFTELGCKLLVDVKTTDGSPLAAPFNERSEYQRGLEFNETELTIDGIDQKRPIRMSSSELDDDYTDDKATLLFEGSGLPPEARGKTAALTMTDLLQTAWYKTAGKPSAAGELSLKDLADALPPPDMSLFKSKPVTHRDGTFARNDYSRIKPPTKHGIRFSKIFPNTYIDTMFVEDDTLMLFGTLTDTAEWGRSRGLMLKNMVTGEVIREGGGGGWSSRKDGKLMTWDLRFEGIKDITEMKNYTIIRPATGRSIFTIDGRGNGEPAPDDTDPMLDLLESQMLGVAAGKWAVSFPLDYDATELVSKTDVPIIYEDRKCKVTQVMLSPFYVFFELEDIDDAPPLTPMQERTDKPDEIVVSAVKKDGTALALPSVSAGWSGGPGDFRTISVDLSNVIDPAGIASVTLNGTVIPLNP